MTKKIFFYMFSCILLVAVIVAAAGGCILRLQLRTQNSAYLKTTLYSVSSYVQTLQTEATHTKDTTESQKMPAQFFAAETSKAYLQALSAASGSQRFTWIAPDGSVLFDSRSSTEKLDNHLHRPEIQKAIQTGYGESSRYSSTLVEQMLYAARLLPDGSVLRVSISSKSVFSVIAKIVPPFLCFIFVLMIASALLSIRIAKHILEPINLLNLDEPEENRAVEYEEIEPLIRRLCKQKTETEKAIQAQQKQRREFEEITSFLSEGLIILNKDAHILSINNSALSLFGIEKSACTGQYVSVLSRNKDFVHLAETGCTQSGSIQLAIDGSWYRISANPAYVDSARTKEAGCILLIVDITAEKTAEESRKMFSANVSHELKTPLTSISGYAEIIRGGIASPQDIPDFADRIYRESTRLLSLINDIIKLSQLDEQTPTLESVNLSAVTEEVCNRIDQYEGTKHKNILINTFIEPDVYINGCKAVLEEMIFNLCDNAVKYNKQNGTLTASLHIRTETEESGTSGQNKQVQLTIADTGIGIPKEEQAKVFERFYRVDKSRSKETGGTGLGLAIVKHAALSHHASIELRSTPGEGTVITVLFPTA